MTEAVFKLEKKVKGLKGRHFSSPETQTGDSAGYEGKYLSTDEKEREIKELKDRLYILEKELQNAREESFQAGYEEGKASALKEAEKQIEIAKIEMHALELKYLEAIEKMEGPLLEIARKMAGQIIQMELETEEKQEQVLIKRLRKMLYDVVDQHKVIVQVHPAHLPKVTDENMKQQIQIPENMELNFIADADLKPGELRISSEDYLIDGRFESGGNSITEQLLNRKDR